MLEQYRTVYEGGEGEITDLSGTAIPAGGTDENGISGAGLPGKLSVF